MPSRGYPRDAVPEDRRSCGSPPSAAVGDCGHIQHLLGASVLARDEAGAMLVWSNNVAWLKVVLESCCRYRDFSAKNWIIEVIFRKIQHCWIAFQLWALVNTWWNTVFCMLPFLFSWIRALPLCSIFISCCAELLLIRSSSPFPKKLACCSTAVAVTGSSRYPQLRHLRKLFLWWCVCNNLLICSNNLLYFHCIFLISEIIFE